MKPRMIVIAGYLAAGKSTFARRLSEELKVPCMIKDTFKSALCASVEITGRQESSRYSAVAFDGMMYVAERLLETGCPVILEGNFVPAGVKKADEAAIIRELADRFGARGLTFQFTGDTRVLYRRFVERNALPERGIANTMFSVPSRGEFDLWCRNLDGFAIGGDVAEVDTTDFALVDFEKHIRIAREFLSRG